MANILQIFGFEKGKEMQLLVIINDDIIRLLYLLFTYDCNVNNVLTQPPIYIFHFNRRQKA